MANKKLELSVILSAYDRMSRVVNDAVNKSTAHLKRLQKDAKEIGKTAQAIGTDAAQIGLAAGAALAGPIKAYADLEDASTSLKSVMMRDGGVISQNFEKVNALATELGNKLPGTTADFQNMMIALVRQGVAEESILQGVGKSAAYLAVALKLPFEDAAKMAAKLKEATGVADAQFTDFMDTIARTNQLGVETGEMQYAFSRSAGALKQLNVQGLEASKAVSVLYATLIKTGASGETVGTGMTSVFNAFYNPEKLAKFNAEAAKLGVSMRFTDAKTGQFLGVENMMAQFDKLKQFNPQQRANLVTALLGPGQDAGFMNTLIDKGIKGYNEMVSRMAAQATLQNKVDAQLATLKNIWDAATGTFTNALAAFGAAIAPELKSLAELFGKLSEKASAFFNSHPKITKFAGLTIAAIAVIGTVLAGLSFTVVGVTKAVGLYASAWTTLATSVFPAVGKAITTMTTFLMANPWVAAIAGLVVVGTLIYTYWDEIVAFFKDIWAPAAPYFEKLWYVIKTIFLAAFNILKIWFFNFTPLGLVIKHWDKLAPYFEMMWNGIKRIFSFAFEVIKGYFLNFTPIGLIIKHWDVIGPYFEKLWDKVSGVFERIITFIKGLATAFYEAGKNIVESIFKGIEDMAYKPIEAMQKMTAKMREYLPFSPAKAGAFRDLHRVKIVETIAQAVKPDPLVKAMRTVTVAGFAAVAPIAAPQAGGGQVAAPFVRPVASTPTAGGNTVVLNYNPTITINGGSEADKSDFRAELQKHSREIERIVRDITDRQQRKSFS